MSDSSNVPTMDESRPLPVLSETDLALVSALQVAPRAPWSAIGRAVGVDPVTAARRWGRLQEERLAWFVVRPSAEQLAPGRDAVVMMLRCRPGTQVAVAERLAAVREAYAVDLLAGDDDIAVTLIGRGLGAMRASVDDLLGGIPEITGARTYFVSQVHREDAQYRLGALSPEKSAELLPAKGGRVTPPAVEVVHEITEVLLEDPRMSLADLGRRMGLSEPTARRLLDRVLRSRAIRLGCDVVASAGGAARGVLIEACFEDPIAAGQAIAELPAVLRCASLVGPANIAVIARFGALDELPAFEASVAAVDPSYVVRSRATVARSVKRQGHVLDDEGRLVHVA